MRRMRVRAGYETVEDAAVAIGLTRPYLNAIETGAKRPSFDVLERMGSAYSCELGDLLPTTAPHMGDLEPLAALLIGFESSERRSIVLQLSNLARSMYNAVNNQETRKRSQPYTPHTPSDDVPFGPSAGGSVLVNEERSSYVPGAPRSKKPRAS